jgi:RNA polymerase sigma-70 factor (ECF subfamily)
MADTAPPSPVTTEVWARFRAGLLRFLRSRLPSATDAEDVLQDVFVRIHEGLGRVEQPDRLQSWVYGIARRAVADFYRERGRRPDAGAEEVEAEPAAWPEAPNLAPYRGEHDVHEEVLSWLVPMVEALPEGYAEAVRLADVEGLPQREVAERLGLSLSGAKSRVQRGRVLLGDALRACCEIEFGADGRAVEYRPRERRCEGAC